MSGLVPGLQNQLERFDSASDLKSKHLLSWQMLAFFMHGCEVMKYCEPKL